MKLGPWNLESEKLPVGALELGSRRPGVVEVHTSLGESLWVIPSQPGKDLTHYDGVKTPAYI